mmetsp:Transcript_91695/g.127329  ORF Transcript_91695/g.127329 Transcript_91695/m.127329 type:complete len:117 (-) Transcript_91695:45-395(-)
MVSSKETRTAFPRRQHHGCKQRMSMMRLLLEGQEVDCRFMAVVTTIIINITTMVITGMVIVATGITDMVITMEAGDMVEVAVAEEEEVEEEDVVVFIITCHIMQRTIFMNFRMGIV